MSDLYYYILAFIAIKYLSEWLVLYKLTGRFSLLYVVPYYANWLAISTVRDDYQTAYRNFLLSLVPGPGYYLMIWIWAQIFRSRGLNPAWAVVFVMVPGLQLIPALFFKQRTAMAG